MLYNTAEDKHLGINQINKALHNRHFQRNNFLNRYQPVTKFFQYFSLHKNKCREE